MQLSRRRKPPEGFILYQAPMSGQEVGQLSIPISCEQLKGLLPVGKKSHMAITIYQLDRVKIMERG